MINQGTGPLPINTTEAEGNRDGHILQGNEKNEEMRPEKKKTNTIFISFLIKISGKNWPY